jgi:hypothetical protein
MPQSKVSRPFLLLTAYAIINKADKLNTVGKLMLADKLNMVGKLMLADIVKLKDLQNKTVLQQQKLQILVKQVTLIYMI